MIDPIYLQIIIPIVTLIGTLLGYMKYRQHKRKEIGVLISREIYTPLNDEVIKIQKQIDDYEWSHFNHDIWPSKLNPIQSIKENAFYVLADESIRRSVEEWQDQAKRYFDIRGILVKEVQRIVDAETDNRMKDIHVDDPTNFRSKVSGKFDEFWRPYYFSRLIRGQVDDEEYYFISNLKGSNDPDIVKFATGFPKAVYERIDEKLVQDLNKAIGDTQNSFSKLKEALGKEISKIK